MFPSTRALLVPLMLLVSLMGSLPVHAAPMDAREVPTLGPVTAKVTIIQIADFQCLFSALAFVTMDQLRQVYGDNLRFVFVNLPISSHRAAVAAMAAHQQGKFWEMYAKLFQRSGALSDVDYAQWAKALNLDTAQFAKDVADPQTAARVDRDVAVAAALDVRATPGFFVNGVFVLGAESLDKFKNVIDAQLWKADRLLQAGATLGADLHAKALRANNPAQADDILRLVFGHDAPPPKVPPPEPIEGTRADTTVWQVPVRGDEPSVGPGNALVTLVAFVDYQCPFSAKYDAELLAFQKAHKRQVRLVFKNLPMSYHRDARGAAEVAMCAHAQGKYPAVAHHMYTHRAELGAATLQRAVVALGVAPDRLAACLKDGTVTKAIETDEEEAEKAQVTGTTTLFFQGRKLTKDRSTDTLKAMLHEELRKAEALVRQGVSAKQVYARTVGNGKVVMPAPLLKAAVALLHNEGAATLGDPKAETQVTVFLDLQSPDSRQLLPLVHELQKRMNGKIRVAVRHFPLSDQCNPYVPRDMHPAACLAAKWCLAAEAQGKFWPLVTRVAEDYALMMPNEGDMAGRLLAQHTKLAAWALEVGMNATHAADSVARGQFARQITADVDDAHDAGVTNSSTLFVDGRLYTGPRTAEALEKTIEQVRAGAL